MAVLPVLAFHAFPQLFPGGFVGVDVFFVISGYLISRIIFAETAASTFSLKNFYAQRVRRIFPALIIVLAAVLVAGWWLLFPTELIRVGQQVVASVLFAANIYLWFQSGYFNPDANSYPLLHLWSLGVEEQFYILWPALCLILRRRPHWIWSAIGTVGLGSFAVNLAIMDHRVAVFYLPVTRAWELMLGAALAWAEFNKSPWVWPASKFAPDIVSFSGLALIAYAVAWFNSNVPYPGWLALVPTLGAALILMSGAASRIGGLILGSRPLVFVGLISYPLYLWHWPMLWLARLRDPTLGTYATIAVCAGAIILAWITYEALERPIRRGYRVLPAFVTGSLMSAMAVAGLAGILYSASGVPGRWSNEVLALLTVRANDKFIEQYRFGRCFLHAAQGPKDFANECLSDVAGAAGHITLWGDSSATALYPGLHALSNGRYDIAMLTSSACPPLMADYRYLSDRPYCPSINQYVLEHIQKTRPDIVILSTAPNYETDIPKQLQETISALKIAGIHTVVVAGPPPLWPFSVPETILRNHFNNPSKELPQSMELPPKEFLSISRLDTRLHDVAVATDAIYVSSLQRLCTDQSCIVMIDGLPITWDQFHFTLEGSLLIARDIYGCLSQEELASNNQQHCK